MSEKLSPTEQYKSIPDSPVTPAPSQQPPQDPEDKHGAKYDNDADGWVRGHTLHPYFDKSPPRSKMRR